MTAVNAIDALLGEIFEKRAMPGGDPASGDLYAPPGGPPWLAMGRLRARRAGLP